MDSTLPNFKVGEAASNIFQKTNVVIPDDSDSSFVVLVKDVIGSLRDSTPNDEQVPQRNLDDQQSILSSAKQNPTPNKEEVLQCDLNELAVSLSASRITRIESRLHQMQEENAKLKKMLEESDAAMKQQLEKVEAWQREVMSACQDQNQKYTGTKKLVDRMKAENDFLRNCVKLQSSASSTALSASTDKKEPLAQNDSSAKAITELPIQTRNSSLDNDMMVVSLQKTTKMSQTPTTETQCISTETSTKTESVTDAYIDTQTPVTKTQSTNTETDLESTMIHSILNVSQSANPVDTKKKLYELIEENRKFKEQSEKVAALLKDFMLVCQDHSQNYVETKKLINQLKVDDFSNGIVSESDASHMEKRNLTQERERLDELKKLLDHEKKLNQEQHQALTRENTMLKSKCDTLEMDLKKFNTKLIDSQKTITELRKQILELQNPPPLNENKQSRILKASEPNAWKPGAWKLNALKPNARKPVACNPIARKPVAWNPNARKPVAWNPNAWKPIKPMVKGALSLEQSKTEALYKKILGILNKFDPKNDVDFVDQVRHLKFDINTQERFQGVIDLMFANVHNAAISRNYATACALMCKEFSNIEVKDAHTQNSSSANFLKLFITRWLTEFRKNSTVDIDIQNEKLKEIDECTDEMFKRFGLNFRANTSRRWAESLGNIRLVGELFLEQMFDHRDIHQCIRYLLARVDDVNLQSLCLLLFTIGKVLKTNQINLSDYFEQIKQIANQKDKLNRITREMLDNVINLEKNKWKDYELYIDYTLINES